MRSICLTALAAAACLAAAPAWAAKPATGVEVFVEQNMAMFDGALAVCQQLDAKTAASMKAELNLLRPQMRSAVQKAFADVPELQQAPAAKEVQASREMMQSLSDMVGQAARAQGPSFCQEMLKSLQTVDPVALAQRARAQYKEYEAAARGKQKP